jgi:hypothetical protein
LLANKDLTVLEICNTVGFESIGSFSNQSRKISFTARKRL